MLKLSQTMPNVSMQLAFKNLVEFNRKCVKESPRCCMNLWNDRKGNVTELYPTKHPNVCGKSPYSGYFDGRPVIFGAVYDILRSIPYCELKSNTLVSHKGVIPSRWLNEGNKGEKGKELPAKDG
uniref:Uncharacterized protein n=1 Tax=Glossina palpalis gambiensis TaxID=67801 RepID=A0A1B0B2D7_9MUSC